MNNLIYFQLFLRDHSPGKSRRLAAVEALAVRAIVVEELLLLPRGAVGVWFIWAFVSAFFQDEGFAELHLLF